MRLTSRKLENALASQAAEMDAEMKIADAIAMESQEKSNANLPANLVSI